MNGKILLPICMLLFLLTGCSWFGTKMIYRTDNDVVKPNYIGYSQLAGEEDLLTIFDSTAVLYERTVANFLDESQMKNKKVDINGFQGFETVDKALIRNICQTQNLDGLLFTELRFLNVDIRTMEMPTNIHADTKVEMQYYNKEGKLLIHVRFNTAMGKSYMSFPPAKRTVPDATEAALKKVVTQFH